MAVRRSGAPFGGEFSEVPVIGTLADLRPSGPTIALICTPTALHLADATAAAALGCHVLIEKPLGARMEGLDQLRSALEHHGARGGVAHSLRFHPIILSLRQRLAEGCIGMVLHTAVWCGQHLSEWRPGADYRQGYSALSALGGGVVLDLIHELDYLRALFGECDEVVARVRRTRHLQIETDDSADILLALGGTAASCHVDYLSRPASRGGIALGVRGTLRWNLLSPSLEEWTLASGGWQSVYEPTVWERNDMYLDELRAFAVHVLDDGPWESGLESGARSLAVALAALRSSAAGVVVRPDY